MKRLALELLDEYDKHISSKILISHGLGHRGQPLDQEGSPRGFSGLHGAAYLGCEEIIITLLKINEWDVRATDSSGKTAITWAARRGRSGVVRVLERDIDNVAGTKYGRTLLSQAAGNGHEGG